MPIVYAIIPEGIQHHPAVPGLLAQDIQVSLVAGMFLSQLCGEQIPILGGQLCVELVDVLERLLQPDKVAVIAGVTQELATPAGLATGMGYIRFSPRTGFR